MNLIIADDHEVTLFGISSFLKRNGHVVLETCTNGIEAWNKINLLRPAAALLDYSMPGMTGLEIIRKIKSEGLKTKSVLFTMHKEKSLLDQALAAGAHGFLLKDGPMDEILECLKQIDAGNKYFSPDLQDKVIISEEGSPESQLDQLSPSEQKILKLIAQQKSSQEIADTFFISIKTVEKHRSNIIRKLGLPQTPNSLALWAARNM